MRLVKTVRLAGLAPKRRGSQVLLAVAAGLLCAAATIPALLPHPDVAPIEAIAPDRATPGPRPAGADRADTGRGADRPTRRTSRTRPSTRTRSCSAARRSCTRSGGRTARAPTSRSRSATSIDSSSSPAPPSTSGGAVGEVSRRTGYRQGGLIVGNHIEETGALAGGICTVSTALFDAAARAGLGIVSRTSHGGYLAKYPLGLDAAVAKSDRSRQTMAFRNDTAEPDRDPDGQLAGDRPGRPLRRDDARAPGHVQRTRHQPPSTTAHDRHVSTRSLPRGQHRRVEPSSDGMTVVVTRTVRDARRPRPPPRPLGVRLPSARRPGARRDELTRRLRPLRPGRCCLQRDPPVTRRPPRGAARRPGRGCSSAA